MITTWDKYIKSIIDKKDLYNLKTALKNNDFVYLYGTGLGKSTLSSILIDAGYRVSEPGMFEYATGPNYIPDIEGLVTFKLKKKTLKDTFKGSKKEIIDWVNS